MPTSRPAPSTKLAKKIAAAALGLLGGAGIGVLYALAHRDKPTAVTIIVFGLVLAPTIGAALWLFWLDRATTDRIAAEHAHDIERSWWERAAAAAFVITMPVLICSDVFGDLLQIGWLSPVGLIHVLAVGLGSLIASYLVIRLRER